MGIFAIPGSPAYEEQMRRKMLYQANGGNPDQMADPYNATNPLVNPTYSDWQRMANQTGQNYGIIDTMLKNDKGMASTYGSSSGAAGSAGGYGGGAGGGAGGYGGMDPALLDSINRDYDRSRMSTMANTKNAMKRQQGSFNTRFGGAETGFLTQANQNLERQQSDSLGQNESNRNRELATARERAEERRLRAEEAAQARIDRQRMANSSAYGGGASYNSKDLGGGSAGYGGASDKVGSGQYTKADWRSSAGVGANFVGGRDPGSTVPGQQAPTQTYQSFSNAGWVPQNPPPPPPPGGANPNQHAGGPTGDIPLSQLEQMQRAGMLSNPAGFTSGSTYGTGRYSAF